MEFKKINLKSFELIIEQVDKKYSLKILNLKFICVVLGILLLLSVQSVKIYLFIKLIFVGSIIFIVYKFMSNKIMSSKKDDIKNSIQNNILSIIAQNCNLVYFPFSKFKLVDFVNTTHFNSNPSLIYSNFSFENKNIIIGDLKLFKSSNKSNGLMAKLKKYIDYLYNEFYQLIGSEFYEKDDNEIFSGIVIEYILNKRIDYKIALFPRNYLMLSYGLKKVDFDDDNFMIFSNNEEICYNIITPEILANFTEISSKFGDLLKLTIENNKIFISFNEMLDLTNANEILKFQDLVINSLKFLQQLNERILAN